MRIVFRPFTDQARYKILFRLPYRCGKIGATFGIGLVELVVRRNLLIPRCKSFRSEKETKVRLIVIGSSVDDLLRNVITVSHVFCYVGSKVTFISERLHGLLHHCNSYGWKRSSRTKFNAEKLVDLHLELFMTDSRKRNQTDHTSCHHNALPNVTWTIEFVSIQGSVDSCNSMKKMVIWKV